jgi:aromatic-L-amino-acid decarboxylase
VQIVVLFLSKVNEQTFKMQHSKFYQLTEQLSKKLHEPVDDISALNQWKTQMIDLIDEISQVKLSSPTINKTSNTSLDPTDWTSARNLAHRMLDTSLDFIQTTRDRYVWQPIPNEIRSTIENESFPEQGQPLSDVCNDILTRVIPYHSGNTHPRFWGWVMGEGTLGGVLADMISSTININAGGRSHCAVLVERTVIQWMRQLFGFPKVDTGGIVVSGTSMATVICMATARQRALNNIRQDGIVNGPHLIVYTSTEVHMCVGKALELLGFGSNAMHLISVDENFCIKIDELKETIKNDRTNGLIPFCIVGNAGTVNTGAFDNLIELSSIAQAENMWFHVDGAFGSLIILDPQRRYLVQGIEQADSLAFDFHKWLHCPYDAGCVLIRDGTQLISTFSVHQAYLAQTDRSYAGDKPWFCDLGTELSRSFRALKVWVTLKEHGCIKLGEKIAENCQQAQYLASLLAKYKDFIRVIHPITLNIVNLRLEPEELNKYNAEFIDEFNNELLNDIQLSGIAIASTTRIHKRLYIRVCIISHRSILEDFDIFVDNLLSMSNIRLQNLNQSTDSVH